MAQRLRVEFEDAIYYLWARGNARQQFLNGDQDRSIRGTARPIGATIWGGDSVLGLMANPFHLIAQTHRPNLRHWTRLKLI
jgi:hypothetical protein